MESLMEDNLPSNWKYAIKNDGRVFFMNDDLQASTWVHPIWNHPVQSGYFRNTDLPEGVEYDYSDEGILYFINHNNLSTSWFPPPQEKVEMRRNSKRSISPFKRTNSKRKSLKKKSVDVKRDRNSEVVMRGWLHRQEGGLGPLKSWKKRWCVLSDMCLFIYKGPEEGDVLGSVLLPSYKITPGQKDSANKKFIFKAEHENMKSERFAGETVDEAEKWMEAMCLASMAVDGTFVEFQDKIDNDDADKNLDLKPSISLPHVFNDSQNLMQNITPFPRNNFENLDGKDHHDQLPESEVKNMHYDKPFVNSRDFDSSDLRSNKYVKNVEKNYDDNRINMSGKSIRSWKDFDAVEDLQPTNEIMQINHDENNLSRVREWTEEQNKYRSGMMPSKSFGEMPFTSPSVNTRIVEPRNCMKGDSGLNFSKNKEDSNEYNFQTDLYHAHPINLQKINIHSNQSDNTIKKDVILSRQSSKNNSEEILLSDSREIETGKVILSTKSSASSSTSNIIKNSIASPTTESMRQTNTVSTISTSPESFKKIDINDLIMKHTNSLKESHNILDIFNQSTWLSSSQKEHLIQVLIRLRRDQTTLHELLYCQMTDDKNSSSNELQTIKMLLNENSLIVNQLESRLYGKSTELTDNNKLATQSLAEIKVEPPKPRKRSTTNATSPLTTPPFDSIVTKNSIEIMALKKSEPLINVDTSYYDFEQPLTSSPNLSFNENQNFRNASQTPEENKLSNKAGYSYFMDEQHEVKNKLDFEQRFRNDPDPFEMTKHEHHRPAVRYQEEKKLFNMREHSPVARNQINTQDEKKSFYTREHSPDLKKREFYTTKEKDFSSGQKLKNNLNNYADENEIGDQIFHRSDRNMPQHLKENKLYNHKDQNNFFAQEPKIKNDINECAGMNKYQMSTKLNMQESLPYKKSLDRYKHIGNDHERSKPYSGQKIINIPETHGSVNEIESTFFETDLDSLQTCNIAKFTYGVTPTDLNKSPAFKKTQEVLDLKSNRSRETTAYHYSKSQHEPSRTKQNLGSSHHRSNYGEGSRSHNIHKDARDCRPELRATEQYKQSIVPLKSSDDCHVSNLSNRHQKVERSEKVHEQNNNFFSEVRQRTQSLSNDDAKEFKDNILRNIKSTQNLNKDEDTEDETNAGFRRSNIRRLSGIFTPRPFYKSRSTNEIQKADDSKMVSDKQREPFMDNLEQNIPYRLVHHDKLYNQQKREFYDETNKICSKHNVESHLRETNLRERTENERKRRQKLLDMRFGLSHESTPRSKYGV